MWSGSGAEREDGACPYAPVSNRGLDESTDEPQTRSEAVLHFYLSFPDQGGADKATGLLEDAAWTVESRFEGEKWRVKAARADISDADLDAFEGGLRDIASSFGGDYDGFERGV
jgi:hypothetical protein